MDVRAGDDSIMTRLARKPWVGFWAQGEDGLRPTDVPGTYQASTLVVDLETEKVVVGAAAVAVGRKTEEFPVAVWVDSNFGGPDYEVRRHPRMRRLRVLPMDLDLMMFTRPPREITVVSQAGESEGNVVESALVIRAGPSELLVRSWPYPPCDFRLSTDGREIAEVLATALGTRVIK